jgi:hypothetical protein
MLDPSSSPSATSFFEPYRTVDDVQRTAIVGGILVPSWVITETARHVETITL